jgi:hypothetical protein
VSVLVLHLRLTIITIMRGLCFGIYDFCHRATGHNVHVHDDMKEYMLISLGVVQVGTGKWLNLNRLRR